MSNRRRSERYAVTLPVVIKGPDGAESTLTANVSAHGVAAFSDRHFHHKQYVQLEISVPPDREIVGVTAMVSRSTQKLQDRSATFQAGVAFDFYLFDGQGRAVWRKFIERMRAGVPHDLPVNPPPVPLSSAPPPEPTAAAKTPEEAVATFSIKPRDLARLWVFLRAELMREKARIETPVLKPVGTQVELLVIHPDSDQEWILRGKVASASEVGRGRGPMLEIALEKLSDDERARFRDFVQTGVIVPGGPAPATEGQATEVGIASLMSRAPSPPPPPPTDEEDLESTDERIPSIPPAPPMREIATDPPGAIPSDALARSEGTFASFFEEFKRRDPEGFTDEEETNPERAAAPPGKLLAQKPLPPLPPLPANGNPVRPSKPPPPPPPPTPRRASAAPVVRPQSLPQNPAARVALLSPSGGVPVASPSKAPAPAKSLSGPVGVARPPPPPPPDERLPAHRNLSTEGSNPELDREIALARARVVRSPDSATAIYQLGRLLLRRGGDGGLKEALKVLERCVELEPNHPGAHYSAAEALAEKGSFDTADEHLRRARRLGYRIDAELERKIAHGKLSK